MRRQDLRTLDRNLIVGVLFVFCSLSILFLLLVMLGMVDATAQAPTTLLWLSYAVLVLVIGSALFLTKKPTLQWKKAQGEEAIIADTGLEAGKSYMTKDHLKALKIFQDAIAKGIPGLCLTRNNPDQAQLKNAEVLWLTEVDAKNAVDPTDLEEITYTVNKYIEKVSAHSIILLDGIEYLISFVGFDKVLHLIQDLRDTMAVKGSILIVPVQEPTLALTASKLLHKELEELV